MGRYDNQEVEVEEDDQSFEPDSRRYAGRQVDQPKRSPIRRKDKWRQEDGVKSKTRRNDKKIQHRLKYNWQGE
jgi:hypothetical protein